MKFLVHFFAVLLFFTVAAGAALSGPPITNNDYRLDLRQGPVIGSAKQVALGGSYIGFGEGINALNSNPSGVAFRPARSKTRFDWDWTLGLNDLDSKDFDNNGSAPPNYLGHKILSMGLMGQYDEWGVGILNNGEILKLENLPEGESEYALNVTNVALGRQFLDQELTLGVGLRTTMIKLRTKRLDTTLGKINGVGWNMGGNLAAQQGKISVGIFIYV